MPEGDVPDTFVVIRVFDHPVDQSELDRFQGVWSTHDGERWDTRGQGVEPSVVAENHQCRRLRSADKDYALYSFLSIVEGIVINSKPLIAKGP